MRRVVHSLSMSRRPYPSPGPCTLEHAPCRNLRPAGGGGRAARGAAPTASARWQGGAGASTRKWNVRPPAAARVWRSRRPGAAATSPAATPTASAYVAAAPGVSTQGNHALARRACAHPARSAADASPSPGPARSHMLISGARRCAAALAAAGRQGERRAVGGAALCRPVPRVPGGLRTASGRPCRDTGASSGRAAAVQPAGAAPQAA